MGEGMIIPLLIKDQSQLARMVIGVSPWTLITRRLMRG